MNWHLYGETGKALEGLAYQFSQSTEEQWCPPTPQEGKPRKVQTRFSLALAPGGNLGPGAEAEGGETPRIGRPELRGARRELRCARPELRGARRELRCARPELRGARRELRCAPRSGSGEMAPPERRRVRGRAGPNFFLRAVCSRNTSGRTYSVREKAGRKHGPPDVFDFPDDSEISSSASEGKKDAEPYETFDPPLHSTAIYADEEELSRHCGSSVRSTPPGEKARGSVNTSENKASEDESVQISAKKPARKRKPLSDDSESCETSEMRRKVSQPEKISVRQYEASPTGMPSGTPGTPAKSALPERRGDLRGQASAERDPLATSRPQKAQRKNVCQGKRRKPRRDTSSADISDSMHIWCLEGKKSSDIMELDIVLSAFEKTILEYKERIESKICKEAINKFHLNIKEELIKMLKEAQMWKNLKRKNAKVISDIEKKRQRLIEVQDEVLR
ncbi:centromere protein U [Ochotona curzoniae]|uniref:centromere protein U n=1 Tax=Ochotona curzoniae TaxID=130825 RepID=UPI001B351C39|nr:centromere protein U [Ochotona curzoniae]